MDTLFLYLLKVGGLLTLFYAAYFFLLRKETFFSSNRWFLLLGLPTSVLLPLVSIEKIIWVEPTPTITQWQELSTTTATEASYSINWFLLIGIVYALGILLFLIQLLLDFRHIRGVLRGVRVREEEQYTLIDVPGEVAPFSFFHYIVYNSELFNETELAHILAHERIHCVQKHSIDVLVSRLFCILFWFHPIMWYYRKAMMQNLEFIADHEATKHLTDKKSYQITLLKVTTQQNSVAITNPFYQSLIKKRIVMLNKHQSKKANYWKYFVMIPMLAAFLFYFQVKVIAQEKKDEARVEHEKNPHVVAVEINKNTTDAQLKKEAEELQKTHGIKLKYSKLKRNAAGEITGIKLEYKDATGAKGLTQSSSDQPIKPILFYKNEDGTLGFSSGSVEKKKYIYSYAIKGNPDDEATVAVLGADQEVDVPDAPDAPDAADAPQAPDAPKSPLVKKSGKSIIIKQLGDDKDNVQIIVDDDLVSVDADKILAELEPMLRSSLSGLDHFRFEFDSDDFDKISKKAMKEARIAIEKARPELERARAEMKRLRPELEEAQKEIELSKPEMEAAKKEMEAAREELRKARMEIEKSRAELDQLRAERGKGKSKK